MVVTKETKQAWLISGICICVIFAMAIMIVKFILLEIDGFVLVSVFGILFGIAFVLLALGLKPTENTKKELLSAYSIKKHIIVASIAVALIIISLIVSFVIQQKMEKGYYYTELKTMTTILFIAFDTLPLWFAMLLQAVIKIIIYYPVYDRVLEEIVAEKMAKKEEKNEPYNLLKEMQKINEKQNK